MGHIYWEKEEIPIPEDAYINHSDGRVFIYLSDSVPTRQRRRMVIGRAVSETSMHPNNNYRYYFPNQWTENYSGRERQSETLRAGLYALSLGIGYKTGLYEDLQSAYGSFNANFLMDYAMYSLERNDVSAGFSGTMKGSVLFSRKVRDDEWVSGFFSSGITEDMNEDFRSRWLKRCRQRGIREAWICIDGNGPEFCPEGGWKAASGRPEDSAIWYLYAISENGTPLTHFLCDGTRLTPEPFQRMAELLSLHGIRTRGVILDGSFCSQAVAETLCQANLACILIPSPGPDVHERSILEYTQKLRWKVRYAVNRKGLFGVQERKRISPEDSEELYISLFHDGLAGAQEAAGLIEEVMNAREKLEEAAAGGKTLPVPKSVQRYLKVVASAEGPRVIWDQKRLQQDVDLCGIRVMASSLDLSLKEMDYLYHLRKNSGSQYAISKRQMEYDLSRSQSLQEMRSRVAACYIGFLLRCELAGTCRKIPIELGSVIRELDEIRLRLAPDGTYHAVHSENGRVQTVLSEYGIQSRDLDFIAENVNRLLDDSLSGEPRPFPDHSKAPSTGKRRRGQSGKS